MFRKVFAACLAATLLILALASCAKSSVPPGMKLASKPEVDGMTLYLPEEYTVTRDRTTGVISAQISKLDPTSIVAYVAHPSEESIERYVEAGLVPERIGEEFAFEAGYPKKQKVAGRQASVYAFTYKRNGTGYRTKQVYVPMGDVPADGVIVLSYTGKTDPTVTGTVLYTKHLDGFDKVLETLEIKAAKPLGTTPHVPGGSMQLASNPDKVDYYFYVPSAWVLDPIGEGMPSAHLPSGHATVSVLRYYPENVSSVADHVAEIVKDYEEFYDTLTPPDKTEKDGVTQYAYTSLTVAGFPAFRYEFSGTLDGVAYRFSQVFILRNKGFTQGLYTVTLTASGETEAEAEQRHTACESDLAAMLGAFRFD